MAGPSPFRIPHSCWFLFVSLLGFYLNTFISPRVFASTAPDLRRWPTRAHSWKLDKQSPLPKRVTGSLTKHRFPDPHRASQARLMNFDNHPGGPQRPTLRHAQNHSTYTKGKPMTDLILEHHK